MNNFLTTTAIIALTAAPAFAQEVTFGKGELNYDFITDGDDDISRTEFSGELEYSVGQFLFGAYLDGSETDLDLGDDLTLRNYGAFVGYAPIDGLLFGVGLTGNSVEIGSFDDDVDGYELFGQYTSDQFSVAANYAVPDSDEDDFDLTTFFAEASVTPEVTVGLIVQKADDIDEKPYYLSAAYETDQFSVEAYHYGISDEDESITGASGAYKFSSELSAGGTVQVDDFFFDDDATYIGLNATYAVADGVTFDASFGVTDVDGFEDATSFGLQVTYLLGEQTRVDRRMTDAAGDNLENGLVAVFPTF